MPSSKSMRSVPASRGLSKYADYIVAESQENVYVNSPIAIGVSILILLIILSYVIKVENNCNVCVNDTNLKSVKYMTVGFITYNILLLLFPALSNIYVHMVLLLVYVIYFINIIIYVKKMNTKHSCHHCAKDWRKTFMNVYSYIIIIGLSLSVIMTLVSIIFAF